MLRAVPGPRLGSPKTPSESASQLAPVVCFFGSRVDGQAGILIPWLDASKYLSAGPCWHAAVCFIGGRRGGWRPGSLTRSTLLTRMLYPWMRKHSTGNHTIKQRAGQSHTLRQAPKSRTAIQLWQCVRRPHMQPKLMVDSRVIIQ